MFDPNPEMDRRWLTVDEAARAMEVDPEEVIEGIRTGALRWTVTSDGILLLQPAIVTRHGPPPAV